MDLATFLIQCLNSLQYGLLLFLVASGLTLIFGIMGVINLAHGSFYMIGAYMAFALAPVVATTFGGGFFAVLLVGTVLAVLLGYVLEWAFFSFLYEREHLQQVLMTYGLILVFEELRSLIVGDDVGARRKLAAVERRERRLGQDAPRDLERLDPFPSILIRGDVVEPERGVRPRIGADDLHGPTGV